MGHVAVVGAGAMGLAAAYHAAKAGHLVEVLEAGPEPGGMAAHFDFDGLSIERFYHFVCKADAPTFALLDELGLGDRMRWRKTSMGYFIDGKLQAWGDPVALLKFPAVSLLARLRYGLLAFVSTRRERWDALENQSAREWITRWGGAEVYDRLWKPLLELKFHEYSDNVSAAWIWTRVKRIGRSRKSLFQEELGYIEGGSQTLVDALVAGIRVPWRPHPPFHARRADPLRKRARDGRADRSRRHCRRRRDLDDARSARLPGGPGPARRLEGEIRCDREYRGLLPPL